MSTWPTTGEIIQRALRDEVRGLLAHCSAEQQERFERFFPGGLDKQDESQLRAAIRLCQRTIDANRIAKATAPGEPS